MKIYLYKTATHTHARTHTHTCICLYLHNSWFPVFRGIRGGFLYFKHFCIHSTLSRL